MIHFSSALLLSVPVVFWNYSNFLYPSFLPDMITVFEKDYVLKLLILLALSSIIVFISGSQLFVSAFRAIRHRTTNTDVLIVIGVLSAYTYSMLTTFFIFLQIEACFCACCIFLLPS